VVRIRDKDNGEACNASGHRERPVATISQESRCPSGACQCVQWRQWSPGERYLVAYDGHSSGGREGDRELSARHFAVRGLQGLSRQNEGIKAPSRKEGRIKPAQQMR